MKLLGAESSASVDPGASLDEGTAVSAGCTSSGRCGYGASRIFLIFILREDLGIDPQPKSATTKMVVAKEDGPLFLAIAEFV